jgi:glutathione synthase/RimK-type ligase-like ATP-grasp enzyme
VTRIAILTPDQNYEEHWQPLADQYLALLGGDIAFPAWNSGADLSHFDLVLPLLTWGYQRTPTRWFKALDVWQAAGVRFANPIATLRWNTDKDYLFDLAAAGVAIVPTTESHSLRPDDLEGAAAAYDTEFLVIKPSISAGADGTYRMRVGNPIPFDVVEREMLIQPLISAVETEGEFSLFYFDGVFSHAILKRPANGDFRVQEQFGGRDVVIEAPSAARALALRAIAAAPALPTYARVDMVRADNGMFLIMELELIEPALFLNHAADGGRAFAAAVERLLSLTPK